MTTSRLAKIEGAFYFLGFLACVPIANWLIQNVGVVCRGPNGPCLIPVGFGYMSPSGVLVIGFAFIMRDFVHRRLGAVWALIAIAGGTIFSALFSPPHLVIASSLAFLFAELMDFAVYAPLQRRRLVLAIVASSIVGIIIDSIMFLYIAFGSIDLLPGSILGKGWAIVLATPLVYLFRWWDERRYAPALAAR